ncbi:nucleoside diphosphate kinase regulator [Gilvimarinus agarilyticus]|uniref:nucleoside diphosphate kinase regulator n=1 Tax=Gilvimarinus agarilyticus TaxID=679259 RepID=UPI0005A1FF27|nr:nucleoside diphosphate kinase regulator [Gilvimarinus agarilyticus]
MGVKPKIILTRKIYNSLSALVDSVPEDDITEQLLDELERAKIVSPQKLPANVVTMHSTVTFTVQSTQKTFTYQLVYPSELDDSEHKLSILTPVGSALIGMQEGAEIDWPLSTSKKTIVQVNKVAPPATL